MRPMSAIPSLSSAALAAYGSPVSSLGLPASDGSAGPAEAGLEAIGQSYADDVAQLQAQVMPQTSGGSGGGATDSLSSTLEALLAPTAGGSLSPDEQMLQDALPASTYSSAAQLVNSGPASQSTLSLYG